MTEYDVIIVGAGPAGSTAGYILSNFGLKVLIIDKSNFPRQKLCAGCITYKTVKFLERIYGNSVSDLKKKHILNFESNQYEIFYKNKSITKKTFNFPFYFVDRYSYDYFFLRRAQQAGAEVIEGEKVISFDIPRTVITTSAGRMFKTKFVIGADGVNSIIRQSFPEKQFERQSWQHNLATALEVFINRSEVRKEIKHPLIFFDFINWGYSWIFPNRERLIVGICGLNRANKKRFLNSFYNFLSVLDLKESRTLKIAGHSLPYGNFLLRPVFKNVVLVGDAAGFADPLLGEGIFYAQRSSELASQAIYKAVYESKNLETTYIQLLQKYLYQEFIYAKKIRCLFYNYLDKFHYYPLKILSNILGKKPVELVHGIRTYKWLRRQAEKTGLTKKSMIIML